MPTLNVDQFDTPPHVGDHVKVLGKVKSINDQTGEVDVSYDTVTIVNAPKNKKASNNNYNNPDNTVPMDQQMQPNTQSLDQAYYFITSTATAETVATSTFAGSITIASREDFAYFSTLKLLVLIFKSS